MKKTFELTESEHIFQTKSFHLDSNFIGVFSLVSIWHYGSIDWGYRLASNRQQAITIANDDPVVWHIWHICASPRLSKYQLLWPSWPVWKLSDLDNVLETIIGKGNYKGIISNSGATDTMPIDDLSSTTGAKASTPGQGWSISSTVKLSAGWCARLN